MTTSCGSSLKVKSSIRETSNELLNQWHKDVAQSNFDAYFGKLTSDAVFIGTDVTEVWDKNEFMNFSKPFFEKKQTWDFKPLKRNIYVANNNKTVWFDEVLDTWMGLCRGSGVLVKKSDGWKIQQYVLSMTIPNEDVKKVIEIKSDQENKVKNALFKLK